MTSPGTTPRSTPLDKSTWEAPTLPAPVRSSAGSAPATAYGHYRVEQRGGGGPWVLGRGGMGVTFKAIDTNLQCPVALKIISPQCFGGEHSERRFIREAQLAAQIRHPNVAAIHHLSCQDGQYFYAMEFVDGITAEAWVRQRGVMLPEMALDIVMQVTRALTAAHRLQVVHRDIKPGNIMILPDPADHTRVIVKLIDFGLARSVAGEASPTATTCSFTGTPQFASPEQAESLELDIRSDIYSLGSTLWFLLLGEAPFGGSPARVIAQLLTSEPPWEKLHSFPRPIVTLLRKMLAKNRDERLQTPVELHDRVCRCREYLAGRKTRALGRAAWPMMETLAAAWRAHRLPLAFSGLLGLVLVFLALSPRPHDDWRSLPPISPVANVETPVAFRPQAAPPAPPVEASALRAEISLSAPEMSLKVASLDNRDDPWSLTGKIPEAEPATNLTTANNVYLTLGGLSDEPSASPPGASLAAAGATPSPSGNERRRGSKSSTQSRRGGSFRPLDQIRNGVTGFVRRLF